MKVIFISNFMNHHQRPLCDYLYANCEEFRFVCMEKMPEQTQKFGYDDLSKLPYVVQYEEKTAVAEEINRLVDEADVAILGALSEPYLHRRMAQNKLSFAFSERLWKLGTYRRFIPFIRKKVTGKYTVYKDKKLYVLAASAFLPYDLRLIGFPVEKCFRWGYFTATQTAESIENILAKKPDIFTICWVGRFIPLKRGKDLLRACARLKKEGYAFAVKFVGSGKLEKQYRKQIRRSHLKENVRLLGNMSQHKVRGEMQTSHALVFSSNYQEGWGAVMNEAMDSACVPVVSHAVGSAAFLVRHGENGLVYQMGSAGDLTAKLRSLMDDRNKTAQLAQNAAHTVKDLYNGQEAGARFLSVCTSLLKGEAPESFAQGPMSPAGILKNRWIKEL